MFLGCLFFRLPVCPSMRTNVRPSMRIFSVFSVTAYLIDTKFSPEVRLLMKNVIMIIMMS